MLVSAEDIVKAMEENGYEWHRNGWFKADITGTIIKACILGQAALNLEISRVDTVRILDIALYGLANDVMALNDNPYNSETYESILKKIKYRLGYVPKETLTKKHSVAKSVRKTRKFGA